ncbi:MAG TPA: bifunctional lysylphosphatidylglycerol flippase/synthetase MprF [Vicinamibacterales bacterium]|nr:bifunctional lysylphosphatidylglycerol flippase/synthetase MprF [Vicinamibacterales bacterium]
MTRPVFERALTWLVAHAARAWGFVVVVVVVALSWTALREIHIHEVRATLRGLSAGWLVIAALVTLANVAIMGLYDAIAFRHTRATAGQRWRYGAVAFCWSNFLTLGPLAGPAIRLWLYRGAVSDVSELRAGIVSVMIAFTSGLGGWGLAALLVSRLGGGPIALGGAALAFVIAAAWIGRAFARRIDQSAAPAAGVAPTVELAIVGWLDWLLAMVVFVACLEATGAATGSLTLAESFFFGQVIGLASLIPGGFGSSDAFWIARLPFDHSTTTAALTAYRFIYYIGPWFTASMLLLSWAARRSATRTAVARRVIGALVGGAGVLIIISSATPALHARLLTLERFVPLPLVEAGQLTAALAGLLLLALARGLARGYRAAFKTAMLVLLLAGFSTLLKGLDWEESATLGTIGLAAWSQAGLFDRDSLGDWLEWADLGLGFAALLLFITFGVFSHHLGGRMPAGWSTSGYHLQAARFLRSAASMALAVLAATLYVLLRTPVPFEPPARDEIDRALAIHAAAGSGTTPLMAAVGDKSLFFDEGRGFCLYRTIGPYLAVFSDPVVRGAGERAPFLDALFTFAAGIDRRPLFYQISPEWIPLLHDRGYHLFKLGEEAMVPLERITLEGRAGKMNRQYLRRAERDGLAFHVLEPAQVSARIADIAEVSRDWLEAKQVLERQFSIGYFEPSYIERGRAAIVEDVGSGRLQAFANLLEGPRREELSVDLMRYRASGPPVMDFLITSILLWGKAQGYRTFNLGMAPLASVGEHRGAHQRERLASLVFRRGEQWYNFQGVRHYKQKFDPDWQPRYLAYESAWEWPVALANVSALIAGGWTRAVTTQGTGADRG